LPPTGIQDALIQSTFCTCPIGQVLAVLILLGLGAFRDIGDLKVFQNDELMFVYQLPGLFVVEVSTLARYLAMRFCYSMDGFLTPMTATLLFREGLLKLFQVLVSLAKVARGLDERAIRERSKMVIPRSTPTSL
jgi:hypothetical protein